MAESPVPVASPQPWQPQVVPAPLDETLEEMQQPLQQADCPALVLWRLQEEAPQQPLESAWLPSSQTWS